MGSCEKEHPSLSSELPPEESLEPALHPVMVSVSLASHAFFSFFAS